MTCQAARQGRNNLTGSRVSCVIETTPTR